MHRWWALAGLCLLTACSVAQEATMTEKITLTVKDRAFVLTLQDNAAARALLARLPLSLKMQELNGNEKYASLANPLPTYTERVGQVHSGEVMLFGDDCLVLFYKSFATSYSYTRIGMLEDAPALAAAVGRGTVEVTLSRAE